MIFSKENVENYWNILNKSGVAEERKAADEFLIEFKVNTYFKIKPIFS
jgi:hypothetical protein